jgi:hypothetical protein
MPINAYASRIMALCCLDPEKMEINNAESFAEKAVRM